VLVHSLCSRCLRGDKSAEKHFTTETRRTPRIPWDLRLGRSGFVSQSYFASGDASIIPKMMPSVSLQYTNQPTPGIGIFGTTTLPPLASTVATDESIFATS